MSEPVDLAQGNGPVIPDFGEGSDCVTENRLFCPDWVRDNWGDVIQPALIQHVKLTRDRGRDRLRDRLRRRAPHAPLPARSSARSAAFSAIVYTIPSLALFQLLVPVTGLTVTTVEVALVGYTLLILYRNILEGLRAVPPEVLEAARGMGLTRGQTLWRVELPLALPAIIAGLRVAVVSTIALATVAALRDPGGARPADLPRAPRGLQDGDHRRRRRSRSRSRSSPTARSCSSQRAADAVGARAEDGVIARQPRRLRRRGRVHRRRAALILDKTVEHLELSVGGDRDRARRRPARSASCSATSTAARSSRSTSRTSAARCRASR